MIISEQNLLELRCELEELITEREGMIAENQYRMQYENSVAYSEDSFWNNAKKIKGIREALIALGEK